MVKMWRYGVLLSCILTFSSGFCGKRQAHQHTLTNQTLKSQNQASVEKKPSKIRKALFVGTGLAMATACLYYLFKDTSLFGGPRTNQDQSTSLKKKLTPSKQENPVLKPLDDNGPAKNVCDFWDIIRSHHTALPGKYTQDNKNPLVIYDNTDSIIIIKSTNRGQPLVIPKKYFKDVREMHNEGDKTYVWHIINGIQKLANDGIKGISGINDIAPTNCFRVEVNNGGNAGQGVFQMHWHFFRGEGTPTPQENESTCSFCKLYKEGDKSIISDLEGDKVAVIEKVANKHYFIFPTSRHIPNVLDLTQGDTEVLWQMIKKAQKLAAGKDFNIYINTGSGTAAQMGKSAHPFIQEYPHMYWEIVLR